MFFPLSTFSRRVLWSGAVLAAASLFHRFWVVPLQQREAESHQELAELRDRLEEARNAIQEIKEKEQHAASGRRMLNALIGDRPAGSATTWLPVELRKHLGSFGIAETSIRQNITKPEAGLPGYERTYWHLKLPSQAGMEGISGMLVAAADMELHFPFIRVLDLSFRCGEEAPFPPSGGLNISALTRK
jgi:hypothetical protein